jgi:hypothetical protein
MCSVSEGGMMAGLITFDYVGKNLREEMRGVLIDDCRHVVSTHETAVYVYPVTQNEHGVYETKATDYVLALEIMSFGFPWDVIDVANIPQMSASEFLLYLTSFLRK